MISYLYGVTVKTYLWCYVVLEVLNELIFKLTTEDVHQRNVRRALKSCQIVRRVRNLHIYLQILSFLFLFWYVYGKRLINIILSGPAADFNSFTR